MEQERCTHELKSAEAGTSQDTKKRRAKCTHQLERINGGTNQNTEKSDWQSGTHHLGCKGVGASQDTERK